MGDPPLETGAVQETVAVALPATALALLGVPGAVAGGKVVVVVGGTVVVVVVGGTVVVVGGTVVVVVVTGAVGVTEMDGALALLVPTVLVAVTVKL